MVNPGPGAEVSAAPPVDVPEPSSSAGAPSASTGRRVVLVVGSGRSGTSTMAGTLQTLGVVVPQPEVVADETNPKGFGEPQWVVDLHEELLRGSNVAVADARPDAWFEAGKVNVLEGQRVRVHAWLEEQFAAGDELCVKDPRLAWFLGLWRAAALRAGAVPVHVTMLRPVTEVVASKQRYYAGKFTEVNRTAAWVNMMLGTERATRGTDRAFIRYADMLTDWTVPVHRLGEQLGLTSVQTASAVDIRKVHQFIDPGLRRVQVTWDDVQVPPRLREIADATWHALDRLPEPGADDAAVHEELDQLRAAYADLYAEAEAISQSTALAEARAAEQRGFRAGAESRRRRRGADLVPHSVRAAVPPSVRTRLRRAMGRAR